MGNIIIPPDMSKMNDERNQIRKNQGDTRNKANSLHQLGSQLSTKGQPQLMPPLTAENIPPTELAAVMPKLQQELSLIQQIEKSIQEKHNAIQKIEQDARNLMIMLIVSGVVVAIILILVVLHLVGVF